MGEIEIAGKNALDAVQRISSNDASKLAVGQAQYSGLLTPEGTFVDDLLVYRLAPQHFLLVVNASHIAEDYAHIAEHIKPAGDAVAVDASSRYALIAVQGPRALEVLQPLTGVDLGVAEVLLVRARRGRQRPRHGLAHGLHRRRRLRDLRAAAVGRPPVAGASSRPAGRVDRSRAASARATRCGSRRRCGCTATTSTRRRPRSRRIWAGSSAGRRTDFIGADGLREQKAAGVRAEDRRVRDARPRHRAPRLRYRTRRRREGRRRHERHADAVPEEGDRHGVRARCDHRPRHGDRASTFAADACAARVVPMPFYKRPK